ncbi:hypothetical protein GA0070216_103263 [Micromonospora matsumotoense]|uniref:Uncharacterized protein n=1 Tax=Micromonospora matsumotoense TaxID=121616 RepID=A0A1C4WD98_9ACTN|nr:hypothetical protein [Micromonospora matsumotoense]SCE94216.1 hypothetical protein GA0070216_103263 [Micromonospora matsumotoense]
MKGHRTDLVSFVFGLIFVGLSLWWLLAQILGLALPAVGWFLAGALVFIGVLGLVGAVRSARTPDRPAPAAAGGEAALAPTGPVGGPVSGPPTGSVSGPVSGPPGGDDERADWRDTAELHLGDPAREPGQQHGWDQRGEPDRPDDEGAQLRPTGELVVPPVTGPPGTPPGASS